jgi:hypothetical protein
VSFFFLILARDKKGSNAFGQNFDTPKFRVDAGSRQKEDSAMITPIKGKFFQQNNHKGNSLRSPGPRKINSTIKNFSKSSSANMYVSDFHERFGSLKECTKFLNFDPECLRDKAGERSELKPFKINDIEGLVWNKNSNTAMSDSTNENGKRLSNFQPAIDINSSSFFSNLNLCGGNGNNSDENQLRENSEPRHEARLLITKKELRYDARAMTVQARDMPLGELADNGRRESDSFGEIIEIDSDAKKNQYHSKKRVKINPAHKIFSEPTKKPTHFKSKLFSK